MADLEELGFLEKTHTSSGRVPSEKGYRFYVDHLLKPQVITAGEVEQIHTLFEKQIFEAEQLIRESANILSELTTYTTTLLLSLKCFAAGRLLEKFPNPLNPLHTPLLSKIMILVMFNYHFTSYRTLRTV